MYLADRWLINQNEQHLTQRLRITLKENRSRDKILAIGSCFFGGGEECCWNGRDLGDDVVHTQGFFPIIDHDLSIYIYMQTNMIVIVASSCGQFCTYLWLVLVDVACLVGIMAASHRCSSLVGTHCTSIPSKDIWNQTWKIKDISEKVTY